MHVNPTVAHVQAIDAYRGCKGNIATNHPVHFLEDKIALCSKRSYLLQDPLSDWVHEPIKKDGHKGSSSKPCARMR